MSATFSGICNGYLRVEWSSRKNKRAKWMLFIAVNLTPGSTDLLQQFCETDWCFTSLFAFVLQSKPDGQNMFRMGSRVYRQGKQNSLFTLFQKNSTISIRSARKPVVFLIESIWKPVDPCREIVRSYMRFDFKMVISPLRGKRIFDTKVNPPVLRKKLFI